MEQGVVTANRFEIMPRLVAEFKENWALLVDSGHSCDFSLPFFHLQTDGFWEVWLGSGKRMVSHIRSIFTLADEVDFARFDEELFLLLAQKNQRDVLLLFLLDTWFPTRKIRFLQTKRSGENWYETVEENILKEKPEEYAPLLDEDVAFVRSAAFQQVVPRVYNYTCCISGMKIIPMANYSMIDACDIIPFRESGDNSINNGIALCPNLHRAFDRHLIGIDGEYRIHVSDAFDELENNPFGLRQFHGKQMLLPDLKKYWPDRERLRERWDRLTMAF